MWNLEECCKEILCLDLQKPARVQQQQHLSMLSFVGVISMPFHLRCCRINCTKCPGIHEATCIGNTHIFATNFMGLEQIFIAGGNDKKKHCHFYDRAWLGFEGIHSFFEKGSFIRECRQMTWEKHMNLWPFWTHLPSGRGWPQAHWGTQTHKVTWLYSFRLVGTTVVSLQGAWVNY